MGELASIEDRAKHLLSLPEGWDNDGGKPISQAAIDSALKVLRSAGHLVPCSDGGVQIDWPGAEITFLPDGSQDLP